MQTSVVSSSPRAVFGKLSLAAFLGVLTAFLCLFLIVAPRIEGDRSMDYAGLGVVIGWLGSIVSSVLAAFGLLRRERPSWPAIIGLSVSIAPTMVGLYLYLAYR